MSYAENPPICAGGIREFYCASIIWLKRDKIQYKLERDIFFYNSHYTFVVKKNPCRITH
jgi:hypothetical protein